MKEFTLNGGYERAGNKFKAVVELRTPDGRVTKTESDVLYSTEDEAKKAAGERIDYILASKEFSDVEVVAKNGVNYQ